MPFESSAQWAKKLVRLPNGATVPVRVRVKTSFIDPIARYQESQYAIDNSANSGRQVHIDPVGGSGGTIYVERIDTWPILDPIERAQETQIAFDNRTVGSSPPPYFITHKKTHLVTYRNNPDDGNSVTSELIDEFTVADPIERAQEADWTLLQPQTDDDAQVQDDDPDITESGGAIDPPWRIDPFQNIVAFSSEVPTEGTGGVIYVCSMGMFFDPDSNTTVRCAIMTNGYSGPPPSGFIEERAAVTGALQTNIYGTYENLPVLSVHVSNPPAGQAWTHFSGASSSNGNLSAVVVSNLGATGDNVSFGFSGIDFVCNPALGPFGSGTHFIMESSVAVTSGGVEAGQTCTLTRIG